VVPDLGFFHPGGKNTHYMPVKTKQKANREPRTPKGTKQIIARLRYTLHDVSPRDLSLDNYVQLAADWHQPTLPHVQSPHQGGPRTDRMNMGRARITCTRATLSVFELGSAYSFATLIL
jgi:hypothetical protein